MDDVLLEVITEGLIGFRRGLLKQVGALDKAIEQLTTLKEGGGWTNGNMGINPNECEHPSGFENGQCARCGVYEEHATPQEGKDIE